MKREAVANNQVCLFFYVKGQFLIHGCSLESAESYGDFLIYPEGHFDVWEKHYARKYRVDYDYFPRGRVAYNKQSKTFQILYDRCIEKEVQSFAKENYPESATLGCDEHYQCHRCNRNYIL